MEPKVNIIPVFGEGEATKREWLLFKSSPIYRDLLSYLRTSESDCMEALVRCEEDKIPFFRAGVQLVRELRKQLETQTTDQEKETQNE